MFGNRLSHVLLAGMQKSTILIREVGNTQQTLHRHFAFNSLIPILGIGFKYTVTKIQEDTCRRLFNQEKENKKIHIFLYLKKDGRMVIYKRGGPWCKQKFVYFEYMLFCIFNFVIM